MKAIHYLSLLLGMVVASCYFFPFVLERFPIANSKMIMAVVGLVLFGLNLVKKSNAVWDKDFILLSITALLMSLIAFASNIINHTPDDTFTTYFMSMWVWLGGAYALVSYIKWVHGSVSVPLVVNYLLAVCVAQCVLALVFDRNASAADWHTRTFAGEAYMGNSEDVDRLHGIGCALDVAGFRFAAMIVAAAYVMYWLSKIGHTRVAYIYIIAILFITLIGNTIARSTIIGVAVAVAFIVFVAFTGQGNGKLLGKLTAIAAVGTVVVVVLYQTDDAFRANMRFGFEGFFSLVEKGQWQTNSNDILKNMVVWPDNLKTWLIGDGYIQNPLDKKLPTYDPFYVGPSFGGYYMSTDIGYLRYIFYFGIIGLLAFSFFLIQACAVCMHRFPAFKWMFLLLLAVNFIQWLKVSTDLFVVFAPFLCISADENEEGIAKYETIEP